MSATQEQVERLTALKDGKCEVYLLKADAAALDALLREREERNDEGIAENHAIFTLTGVPRPGFSLQQEIRAQLEESQARVRELEAQLQASEEARKRAEAERDDALRTVGRQLVQMATLRVFIKHVASLRVGNVPPYEEAEALLAEADQKGEAHDGR